MPNLDNRIDAALHAVRNRENCPGDKDAAGMRIPNIRPGYSLGHRIVTRIASTALGIRIIRRVGPHIDPTLIRLTGGRLSSVTPFPALLLSHTGARSGVTRVTPVVYFTDAGRVIVIASNFGAPKNPAWYHNIKANPEVTLLGRGFRGSFLAEEVVGPERDRLFQVAAGASSPYDHYQQSAATRPIAVIAFRPARSLGGVRRR
jgi:deazaflavin-dependent oxidoreductase (nitroreductase family)